MSKNWWIGAIICVIAFILGAISSYFPLNAHFQAKLEGLTPDMVEVVKVDTLRLVEPVFVDRKIIEKDTIKIPVTDTLVRNDTIYLPREQKYYEDKEYRAWVSGYEPRLDSLYVFPKTIETTKTFTKKEWRKFSYGIQAGVGLVAPIKGSPTFGGYVGFGVGYTF